jgi:subtilisin family serine protease
VSFWGGIIAAVILSVSVVANDKYFVILTHSLGGANISSFQTLGSSVGNISALSVNEQALVSAAFTHPGIQGVRYFMTYGQGASNITPSGLGASANNEAHYVYQIKVAPDAVDAVQAAMTQLSGFVHFQPNFTYRAFSTNSFTSEPGYTTYQETDMALMGIPDAWGHATGNAVRVAVLDTGIFANHQDFCDGTADVTNTSIDQTMTVDNCPKLDNPYDFIDDYYPSALDGYYPVSGADYDTPDPAPIDADGHGTHVSGIIGAALNSKGMVGVAPGATIIPIAVMAPYGYSDGVSQKTTATGTTEFIVRGINYAVTNNAHIINMSLGGSLLGDMSADLLVQQAVNNAVNQGVVVIAAAGNSAQDVAENKVVPAYYPNVVSVSAVTNTGTFASYSNYGEAIDIAAVGGDNTRMNGCVFSASIEGNNKYERQCGTSMAAPYVSGIVALMVDYRQQTNQPRLLPNVIQRVIQKSGRTSTQKTDTLGYGIINAGQALYYMGAGVADTTATGTSDVTTYDFSNQLVCYPNPFYRSTTATMACDVYSKGTGRATYAIYSRRGQRVFHGDMAIGLGKNTITWHGKGMSGESLPNGVYALMVTVTPDNGPTTTKKHLITLLR